jgi:large subunit ribosomal protein L35
MPKIKTNRSAAKRFKTTASGRIKRASAYRSHILSSKTTKRKRQLRGEKYIHESNEKQIRKLIPYL